MDTPLLSTKLFAPPDSPRYVARTRLYHLLSLGLNARLMIVSAPAGFGKTTLVCSWLHSFDAGEQDRAVFCWLSLDDGDNDISRFIVYLGAAFRTLASSAGAQPLENNYAQQLNVEDTLNTYINHLAEIKRQMLLVLDDYHLISSQEVHQVLNYLVEHLPPQLHLVIITRVDPPLQIARLRARAEMVEIRQKDLRFTPDEARTFFEQSRGISLSYDQAALLTKRTEGWIAGLQMAALSIQSENDTRTTQNITRFIQDFSGSSRFVFDYLMEEILSRQPAYIQDFLLQTSILKRLCSSLCDALMERGSGNNSSRILETMEHGNIFIFALDSQRRWYRYHHLFSELLQQRLATTYPDRLAELHRRASRWFEENHMLSEAIEHALAAGKAQGAAAEDFKRALDLIESEAEAALSRCEIVNFSRWVEALPKELVRSRPYLCVYYAFSQLVTCGSSEKITASIKDAQNAASEPAVEASIAAIQALVDGFHGSSDFFINISDELLESLPENKRFLRSLIVTLQSISETYFSDTPYSCERMEQASNYCRETGNWMAYNMLRTQIGDLLAVQGRLHAANAEFEHVIKAVYDDSSRHSPGAALAFISRGYVLYQWNDLEAARQSLARGFKLIHGWGDVIAIDYHIYMMRLCHALDDQVGALEQIRKAEQLAAQFDVSSLDDRYIQLLQARLMVLQGDIAAAERWSRQRGFDEDAEILLEKLTAGTLSVFEQLIYELELLTLSRLYLARNQPVQSGMIIEVLLPLFEKQEWNLFFIEALLIKSLTCHMTGAAPDAISALERALALTEPEGFVRIFLEEGEAMARLLAFAQPRLQNERLGGYARKLLKAFDDEKSFVYTAADDTSLNDKSALAVLDSGEMLSSREREVLAYLASGLSNQQIAGQMVIALSTVKSHIHNIYQKLGVSNRTSAVALARKLRLL